MEPSSRGWVGVEVGIRISTGFLVVNRGVFYKTVVIRPSFYCGFGSFDNLSRAEEDTGSVSGVHAPS